MRFHLRRPRPTAVVALTGQRCAVVRPPNLRQAWSLDAEGERVNTVWYEIPDAPPEDFSAIPYAAPMCPNQPTALAPKPGPYDQDNDPED